MVQFEDDRRDRGWFMRGERMGHERQSRLKRVFGEKREALVGALALVFAFGVAGFVIKDAFLASAKDRSGLERIVAVHWNERTRAFPIAGRDHAGRQAHFDVVVLTKNYGWVKGSTTELERGDARLTAQDIEEEILAPQVRKGLAPAQELIAVGLASVEGDIAREEQRGGLRAVRIADWLRGAIGRSMPLMTLNLGRYIDLCSDCETDDTSWQRPVMIVAIKKSDPGTDIGEALRDAMSNKANLPSPDRYSAFVLSKYTK